jgi:hypothetical protein
MLCLERDPVLLREPVPVAKVTTQAGEAIDIPPEPGGYRTLSGEEAKRLLDALRLVCPPSQAEATFGDTSSAGIDLVFGGEKRQTRRIRWNSKDVIRFLRVDSDSHTSSFILFKCPGISSMVGEFLGKRKSAEHPVAGD